MRVHSSQLKFAVFVVVAWAAFQAALLLANPTSPIHGRLTDPDGYMRLVRVEELAHTHDWYDSTIARSNAPYGEELHWTRPFDVMILAGAAPLQPFLGTDRAIFWSGSLICPLLMLGVLFAVCWAAAPLVPDGKWLIVAALLVQPMLITDSLPGRFDHHILQILLFVILVGAAIRLCARPDRRMAVLAGASAAVGIWVSVEMLVPFVAIVAVFAIGWILDGRREKLRTVVEVTTSQAALLALALAVERSPGHWFDVDYDKVSIAYVFGSVVLAAASTAVYFATARTSASARGARIIVAGVAAAACFGALALAFPTALKGPEAGIDPAIRPIWLDHVTEMQPVFGTWPSVSGTFLQIAAQGTLAAFALVFILRAEWKTPKFFAWACVGSLLAIYLVSTYLHVRSGGFLAIVASVVIARSLIDLRVWLGARSLPFVRSLAWSSAAVGCIAGFMVSGRALAARADAPEVIAQIESCRLDEISDFLDARYAASPEPQVMAANIDFGPEILYRTPFSVLAGPYHRNNTGILDLHNMFVSDPAVSLGIVEQRGVTLLLVCPEPGEKIFLGHPESSGSLYSRLVNGEDVPGWLQQVPIPDSSKSAFKLYEVLPR